MRRASDRAEDNLPLPQSVPEEVPVAVYRSAGRVDVDTRPLPFVGDHDVVVEISYCGVCGSDLHLIVEGWGTPDDVLGHEWSGRVVTTGAAVRDLAPGDWVIGVDDPSCGQCAACRDSRPSQCVAQAAMTGHMDGAFATHVVRPRHGVLAVPDGLDVRVAALAEPLAVALHGLSRAQLTEGAAPADVLVLGAGPIGALAAATAVVRGHRVVVAEPAPSRAAMAAHLGVASVVHPDDLALFSMIEVDAVASPAYDVVIETSGKSSAMEAGFCQLRRGGRMVLVGTGAERPRFDPNRFVVMELEVHGAYIYDAGGMADALSLLASGVLPVNVLIDDAEFGLDGVAAAAAQLAAGDLAGKVLIRPSLTPGVPGARFGNERG